MNKLDTSPVLLGQLNNGGFICFTCSTDRNTKKSYEIFVRKSYRSIVYDIGREDSFQMFHAIT